MQSLSLVMSECSLSGRGHVSNFYIVDLENFATASRPYTGDIHNSAVVGLFITPVMVIGLVCCAHSLYPGICSVLFSLGITSFSANHRARISQYK